MRTINLSRRKFLIASTRFGPVVAIANAAAGAALSQTNFLRGPNGPNRRAPDLIPAPADPEQRPAWRDELKRWRTSLQRSLSYDDSLYERPEFAWVKRDFSCCFVMLCDEMFYDAKLGRFTVESFLDHGLREFGGYDSLVFWHAYPRIGFDERNQFDFYRDMGGGLEGLRTVSRRCHERGVKVFVDYNPWDTGTRRDGLADLDALAALVKAIEADGIFLDTMNRGAEEFRAKLDAARSGVVLEGEGALPLENIHDHHCSWAQGFQDGRVPGVLRNKWFERRHLQHQIKRWDRDHTGELHSAWMNGSGMMVWENVFGSWVGWSARDRSLLRTMLPIQRRYADLFCGEGWTPLVPTEHPDVCSSLWEGGGLRLWTLVNRSAQTVNGALLRIQGEPETRCFDLVQGREAETKRPSEKSAPGSTGYQPAWPKPLRLGEGPPVPSGNLPDGMGAASINNPGTGFVATPTAIPVGKLPTGAGRSPAPPIFQTGSEAEGNSVLLSGSIQPRGIGAFIAGQPATLGKEFADFLAGQARVQERANFDPSFPMRGVELTQPHPTAKQTAAPPGMVEIAAASFSMQTEFQTRECGFYESVPGPGLNWGELHRPKIFTREVKLSRYAIDLTPVTNAQFAAFLKVTRYHPRHPENFLKHWLDGAPPPGRADHPVVCVSLEDARAYAAWAGKRLPTEEEWQHAAQGPEQRLYPWGNEMRPGVCNDGSRDGTTSVTAFPAGRSPFGCFDMCGNIWHWTESERGDGRTRFCILKGGSWFQARGSIWYADGGPKPCRFAAKFLMMWPGLDRGSTIGFRCVVDLVS